MESPRAVVTGSSSGIGAAISAALTRRGFGVERISRTSGVDVTDVKEVKGRYERMGDPTPEILVAAAGIQMPCSFPNVPYDEFRRVMDVNVAGTFIVAQEHARRLIAANRPGKIMLFGSPSGRRPSLENLSYGVSKAAVLAMGLGLARGLESHGIKVYIMCPSHVDTPMLRGRGFDLNIVPLMKDSEFAEEAVQLLILDNTLDGQPLYFSRMVTAKQQ